MFQESRKLHRALPFFSPLKKGLLSWIHDVLRVLSVVVECVWGCIFSLIRSAGLRSL